MNLTLSELVTLGVVETLGVLYAPLRYATVTAGPVLWSAFSVLALLPFVVGFALREPPGASAEVEIDAAKPVSSVRRILAQIVDAPIVATLFFSVSQTIYNGISLLCVRGQAASLREAIAAALMILAISILNPIWIYYAGCQSSHLQGTIGQRLIGIKVVDAMMRPVTFSTATRRYLAKLLVILTGGIGFLPVVFSSKAVAWHDWLSGTRVMNRHGISEPQLAP